MGTTKQKVTESAATPTIVQYTELQLESAVVGTPVMIGDKLGAVQSRRSTFALVTTRPDATSPTGVRGMKGNIGNRSKTSKPGCGCKVPTVGAGFLYAFIGAVPADFDGAPATGTICESCDRAVIAS